MGHRLDHLEPCTGALEDGDDDDVGPLVMGRHRIHEAVVSHPLGPHGATRGRADVVEHGRNDVAQRGKDLANQPGDASLIGAVGTRADEQQPQRLIGADGGRRKRRHGIGRVRADLDAPGAAGTHDPRIKLGDGDAEIEPAPGIALLSRHPTRVDRVEEAPSAGGVDGGLLQDLVLHVVRRVYGHRPLERPEARDAGIIEMDDRGRVVGERFVERSAERWQLIAPEVPRSAAPNEAEELVASLAGSKPRDRHQLDSWKRGLELLAVEVAVRRPRIVSEGEQRRSKLRAQRAQKPMRADAPPVGERPWRTARDEEQAIGHASTLGQSMRLVVVCCFLNEERLLPAMLASVAGQSRPADRLLLVDDGSEDRSAEIAEAFARDHDYATALRRLSRPPQRDRLATAAELRAFQWALTQITEDWDVLAKLDADLRLTPTTFAEVEAQFASDPWLGMTGPYLSAGGERERCPPHHVRGPVKFYRRACYEQIAPLPPILGWDTIDEIDARRHGWVARSFAAAGGDPEHLRPVATADGLLRGVRRMGICAWGFGAHPLHVAAGAASRLRDRPPLLAALHYLLGWAWAGLRSAPRAAPEIRAYGRREQLARLRRQALGRR
jgi:biofilm PGA synthesis N-glycosyltransferase PgaC